MALGEKKKKRGEKTPNECTLGKIFYCTMKRKDYLVCQPRNSHDSLGFDKKKFQPANWQTKELLQVWKEHFVFINIQEIQISWS